MYAETAARSAIVLGLSIATCLPFDTHGQTPDVPIAAGVNIVLAVDSGTAPPDAKAGGGILQGDYEMVVTFGAVDQDGMTQIAFLDGFDETKTHKRLSVTRSVSTVDLTTSRLQILGFHTSDPSVIPGTTTLGPSIAVARDLTEKGQTDYAFRQYKSTDTVTGTLTRSADSPVAFPVLLNGQRVELQAIRAIGHMGVGKAKRPFETYILDHPRHPLSLRIAYGPRDGGFPFEPDFLREVVRIDVPASLLAQSGLTAAAQKSSIAERLEKSCRAELSGIYFDFNQATLKEQSRPTLQEIAEFLRAAGTRSFRLEGHTDNIGTDAFNDALSAKRAAAVKQALASEFAIDASRLSTQSYGERRPIESNDTLAGRARNRRVELVCAEQSY